MKNKIIIIFIIMLFSHCIWGQPYAGRMFPYYISFEEGEGTNRIEEIIGNGAPTGSKRYTDDGILLTDDTKNSMSGFYLDDLIIKKNYMFNLRFEYAAFGGTPSNGEYGEGLTMFLFDADKGFSLGSGGSGLGYAYNNAGSKQAGLAGAYLGIGFDTYGDFKNRMNTTSIKREGVNGVLFQYDNSHITIRGGQHKSDRYKGYPVVYTRSSSGGSNLNSGAVYAILDGDTGDYEEDFTPNSVAQIRTNYGQYIKYNGVNLTVHPIDSGREGWKINTSLKYDNGYYSGLGREAKLLNVTRTRDENGNLYTFESNNPEEMRLGFVATTSQATQKHLIKDVSINLLNVPETKDEVITLCLSADDDTEIYTSIKNPFKTGRFYAGSWDQLKSGSSFREIDFDSSRLEDEEGVPLNYEIEKYPNLDTYSLIYKEPGVGTWDLYIDSTAMTLFFTPAYKKMPEGEYSIYLSAKSVDLGLGGPFSDEAYRCRPTKITVKVKYCKSVVNPRIPIKVRKEE